MEGSDRNGLDNSWANALGDAELQPRPEVWNQINAALVAEENVLMRSRFIYWRWAAAAAVLLFVLAGATGYYFYDQNQALQNQLSLRNNQTGDLNSVDHMIDGSLAATGNTPDDATEQPSQLSNTTDGENSNDRAIQNVPETGNSHSDQLASVVIAEVTEGEETNRITGNLLSDQPREDNLVEGTQTPVPVEFALAEGYGLTDQQFSYEDNMRKRYVIRIEAPEEEEERTLWAGLDMGGGIYSPDTQLPSLSLASADAAEAFDGSSGTRSNRINGDAQLFGVGVGKSLTKRLHLQSGLRYSTVTSGYYSGNDPALYSENVQASLDDARTSFSNSNAANSLLRVERYNFISIPLEAGYDVLHGKFSISINPGIDSRIYLNRETQQYVSGNPADIVPTEINPLTVWGMISTDFSYRLGEHYQIVVRPNYRLALNSIERGGSVHPNMKQLTFSMRYLFDAN